MDIQEKIDAYFGGTLSKKEMEDLESLIKEHPEFQKEFELQNDISEAFKQIRIEELKTQLNSIDVSPGTFNTPWVKILSTVAIVSGIGIISYFFLKSSEETPPPPQQEVTVPAQDQPKNTEPSKPIDTSTPDKEVAKEGKSTETKPANPVPVKPNVIEGFQDEETSDSISVPQNNAFENATFSNSSVEFEIKKDPNYDFHYKFLGERLFLYGDFRDDLYNILEIKGDSTSQLFFYYKDAYYFLDKKQTEITPLKAIKDQNLITQLDSLREKK